MSVPTYLQKVPIELVEDYFKKVKNRKIKMSQKTFTYNVRSYRGTPVDKMDFVHGGKHFGNTGTFRFYTDDKKEAGEIAVFIRKSTIQKCGSTITISTKKPFERTFIVEFPTTEEAETFENDFHDFMINKYEGLNESPPRTSSLEVGDSDNIPSTPPSTNSLSSSTTSSSD